MERIKTIVHDNNEFLMVFHDGQWWYVADAIAKYLDYVDGAKSINRILNDEHKFILKKKGNEEIFSKIRDYFAGASDALGNKTNNISLINEDGLIISAMKSTKPNAKLLVKDMIKVFKLELNKSGLSALDYLLRVEKDKNILINARSTKYYNAGYIKYTPMIINKAINELVFYKFFPDEKYGDDINTDKLRKAYQTKDGMEDRDVSGDRYEIGVALLGMLYDYYLFNGRWMNLKQAKYLYVQHNEYAEHIVEIFKERLGA